MIPQCSADDCDRDVQARGLCPMHYMRLRRSGDIVVAPRRTLTESRVAFQADPADPRHGTQNGYGNLKCRCARCRRANADTQIDYLDRHPEQREINRQRGKLYYAGVRGRRRMVREAIAGSLVGCVIDQAEWHKAGVNGRLRLVLRLADGRVLTVRELGVLAPTVDGVSSYGLTVLGGLAQEP